jgi:NitT/TauT family transport system ATP-binding protein
MGFRCEDVSRSFKARGRTVAALEGVSFGVEAREFVSIVGPSGCGKTTLLKVVAGLLAPTSGRVEQRSAESGDRPATALVFQDHGLFPWMSVVDNVAFGLETRGVGRAERRQRAGAFIESVGLTAFARAYPHELSVGMRQRVGIARAFLTDPRILLLDEPFASLDAQTRLILQDELLNLWSTSGSAVVLVTHDIEEAIRLGDRVLVMTGRPGRIQGDIPVPLSRPRHLEVLADPRLQEIKWRIWRMLEPEARRNAFQT